jgi:formylglycine-generating enzyme required for sulfatase activity
MLRVLVFLCLVASTAYAQIDAGLVAYYPFSGNANDDTGRGNHGVVHDTTLTTDRFGNANRAYRFNGTNSFIQIASSVFDPATETNGFTVVAWVKADSLAYGGQNRIRPILFKRKVGGLSYSPQLLLMLDGRDQRNNAGFYLGSGINPEDYSAVISEIAGIQTGQWTMVTGVYRPGAETKSIYIDGKLVSTAPHVDFAPVSPSDILVGRSEYGDCFDGAIDDLRFYNRALSDSEIQQLYLQTSKVVDGFVWIPPGSFVMGSPGSETGRSLEEVQHSVTLTQGFWMSDHEVTQSEYEVVMGVNPSSFRGNGNRPVEQVSWDDALTYCQKLTERERGAGRITGFQAYRLPTEAEWEYAARAGTVAARPGELNRIGWQKGNANEETHPVKQLSANAWGLYDMLGNVWEWCSDWHGDYPEGHTHDPVGPASGLLRVNRGGSWSSAANWCRSASRGRNNPIDKNYLIGFRPVLATVPRGPAGFVWIPPGTFMMGSPTNELDRFINEIQHPVTLTRGFWLSDHEVTQGEYQSVVGSNPSARQGDLNRPVENISWHQAVRYCQKLTERERAAARITPQQSYRLPTEAEWEHAARGGTTGARYGELDAIAWWSGNSDGQTRVVKGKQPNRLGLYDMLGGVWEWCSDWTGEYPIGSATDPSGPAFGTERILRGGCFFDEAKYVRAAYRNYTSPDFSNFATGLRPALDAAPSVTNLPPRLAGATNATIKELEGHVQDLVPQDDDVPAQSLTVALVSGPMGLVVTNGVLAWTPTEAQGPSTNRIVVTVSDGLATVTHEFTLTVLEVGDGGPTNPPPVLIKKSLSTSDLSLWTVLTRGGTSPLVSRYGAGGLIGGAPGYDGWWSLTTRFFLPADSIDPKLTLSSIGVDDTAVLYLNGVEVASTGIGAPATGVFKRALDAAFASQQFKNPLGTVSPPQAIGATLIVGATNVLEMVVNNNNIGITQSSILTSDYSTYAHLVTELSYGQPAATNFPTGSFSVVEGSFTWAQAKADAEARGGYLATFTSPEEWARGSAVAGSRSLWIGAYQGANRVEPAGGWGWITDEPWGFTAWGLGEPNNSGTEDHAVIWSHPKWGNVPAWVDYNEGGKYGYLLEKPLMWQDPEQSVAYGSTGWIYRQVSPGELPGFPSQYPTNGFQSGQGGFGAGSGCAIASSIRTPWALFTDLLVTRPVVLSKAGISVELGVAIDNRVEIWWNGQRMTPGVVSSDGCAVADRLVYRVPAEWVIAGTNTVAFRCADLGDMSYFDARITVKDEAGVSLARLTVEETDGTPVSDDSEAVDFGSVRLGDPGKGRTLVIRNTGSIPVSNLWVRVDEATFSLPGVAKPASVGPEPKSRPQRTVAAAAAARVRVVELEAPDLVRVLAEDEAHRLNSTDNAQRIGIRRSLPEIVPLRPDSPDWETLPDGTRTWALRLASRQAQAMRIRLDLLSVDAGTIIQVRDPARTDEPGLRVPAVDLVSGRTVWTPSISGEWVEMEVRVPAGLALPGLDIAEVTHRYVDPAPARPKAAQNCHIDVSCEPDWFESSLAVSGLTVVTAGGEGFCSGCLLTDADPAPGTDYYLTAAHCIDDQTEANTVEFYWRYQSSRCNGPVPSMLDVPRTIGGADMLSRVSREAGNDHCLLRIRGAIPAGVAYAGWNSNPLVEQEALVGIHHPAGDFKRISFATLEGGRTDPEYWEFQWDRGLVEPGSSGSPLFNLDHQVVGQLFGRRAGDNTCSASIHWGKYGRFDRTFPRIARWLLGTPVRPLSRDYSVAPPGDTVLLPGQSVRVVVDFRPVASGIRRGTLQAGAGRADAPPLASVELVGSGLGTNTLAFVGLKDVEIPEGTTYETPLAVTGGASGGPVTFSLLQAPDGASVAGGVFRWTPTEAQGPGTYTLRVLAKDATASVTDAFQVRVLEVNRPPVVEISRPQTLYADQPARVMAVGTDPDLPRQALFYRLLESPAGATIDRLSGAVSWTPVGSGSAYFTVEVSDGTLMSTNSWFLTWVKAPVLDPGLAIRGLVGIDAGFLWQTHQLAGGRDNSLDLAERQLRGELGASIHDPAGEYEGFFEVGLVNFEQSGSPAGFFRSDGSGAQKVADGLIPGIPGRNGSTDYIAAAAYTWVEFPQPGTFTMGVHSDDGFRVSLFSDDTDTAQILGQFDGGRFGAESQFTFQVDEPGLYPMRLLWMEGILEASVEWYSVAPDGSRLLVNGGQPGALKAFRDAVPPGVPYLVGLTNRVMEPGTSLAFQLAAVDSDTSTAGLSFGLVKGPPGMTVSPVGRVAWTPGPGQSPSTNWVVVFVSDGTDATTNHFHVVSRSPFRPGSFSVVEGTFTWAQAKADAEVRGGHLATFTTLEEWNRGTSVAGNQSLWIGAYQGAAKVEPAGGWLWVTGEPWGFTAWGPGEPNNFGGEDYAHMLYTPKVSGMTWNDAPVNFSHPKGYLLEIPPPPPNTPPVFSPVADQVIGPADSLALALSATDSDIPLQTLEYKLVQGPTGMTVSGVGVVRWTPTSAQRPSTNAVRVAVSDGLAAVTNAFRVIAESAPKPLIPPVRAQLVSGSGPVGATLALPVTVRSFNAVETLQGTLEWDPTLLRFLGVTNVAIRGLSAANFGSITNAGGQVGRVSLSWDDPELTGVTLTNGASVFSMLFVVIGRPGNQIPIRWSDQPTPRSASVSSEEVGLVTTDAWITVDSEVTGRIDYYAGAAGPLGGVTVQMSSGSVSRSVLSSATGNFSMPAESGAFDLTPILESDEPLANGITTLDISLMRRHVLGIVPLDSPAKVLAADVNGSGSINTIDISWVRRFILGSITRYPAGLWRFLPTTHATLEPSTAWSAPQKRTVAADLANLGGMDFVGIKLGDVNGSWRSSATPSSNQAFAVVTGRRLRLGGGTVDRGGMALVPLWLDGAGPLTSLQLSLRWDARKLRFQGLADSTLPGFGPGNLGAGDSGDGVLSLSWDPPSGVGHSATSGEPCLNLRFEAVGLPGDAVALAFAQTPAAIEIAEDFVEVPVLTQDASWRIGGPGPQGLRISIRPSTEERLVHLEIRSDVSASVLLERSSNLVDWQVYQTLDLPAGGSVGFEVPKVESGGPGFWRARHP